MVWAILQVFLQCLPLGGLSWLGERGFKRCKYSHSDHDLQVAKCPVESAACAVLPYFQIQRWWVGSVCWETVSSTGIGTSVQGRLADVMVEDCAIFNGDYVFVFGCLVASVRTARTEAQKNNEVLFLGD
jgi:hypothetical protein